MDEIQKKEYFKNLAHQLIREVSPPEEFKRFVGNHPDLLGKYIESAIRRFIKKIILNGRISTGGVICPEKSIAENQIDVIIWKPNPFPAIFECENFAIVPRQSVFGLIEIKSSNYKGAITKIDEFHQLCLQTNLINSYKAVDEFIKVKSIICVFTGKKNDTINKECIILYTKKNKKSKPEPNTKEIIKFIEYLAYLQYYLGNTFDKPSNDLINSLD